MNHKCLFCLTRSAEKLIDKSGLDEEGRFKLTQRLIQVLAMGQNEPLMPIITSEFQNTYRQLTGITDPYSDDKTFANKMLLSKYEHFKSLVNNSSNPFETALRLSIAGNIIDLGLDHQFDIDETINKVLNADFGINHSTELHQKIKNANNILYIGDNCGEIVLDKLFLETINHPNVTFVVREAPVLNDATMKEALDVGIDKFAKVITNNFVAPSTVLKKAGDDLLQAFQNADVIISKGIGNYEGLSHLLDKRMYFLLMVKCKVVADELGLHKGDFIAAQGDKLYINKLNFQQV